MNLDKNNFLDRGFGSIYDYDGSKLPISFDEAIEKGFKEIGLTYENDDGRRYTVKGIVTKYEDDYVTFKVKSVISKRLPNRLIDEYYGDDINATELTIHKKFVNCAVG